VGLALFCPITSQVKGYPSDVMREAVGRILALVDAAEDAR